MSEYLTKYFNAATFNDATTVYDNAILTSVSVNGYYSDGVVTRYQTSGVLGPNLTCPSCPSFSCTSGVDIPLGTQVARFDLQTQFNTVGAIKVTVKRIDLAPVGIQLLIDEVPIDNIFSFTPPAASSSYPEGPVSAPSFNELSFFSTNNITFKDPACDEYLFSSINLNTYTYNGVDWGSNNTLINVPLSNKATAIPRVATTQTDLVMYIPKTSVSPVTTLRTIGVTTCPATSDLKVEIECPAVLPSISVLGFDSTSSVDACSDSEAITVYHGAVAGTSGTLIKINDWVFSDANSNSKPANGYYKVDGTILDGVPSSPGTFKLVNGVVSEIQTC